MEIRKIFPLVCLPFILLLGMACSRDEAAEEPIVYDGPLIQSDSIRMLYSDSAVVMVMLEAPKQYTYENQDTEFPEGFYIQFFERDGSISSTLKADYGYSFAEEDRYTGVGNIVLNGLKQNNKLLTDTLHWSRREAKMYTKAPVTIIEGLDTLRGIGLEAAEDFSTYTILKPVGTTILNEEPSDEDEEELDEDN